MTSGAYKGLLSTFSLSLSVFCFVLAPPWHMEFLGQGSDLSCNCNLYHIFSNSRSFSPLCQAGDWTCFLVLQRCHHPVVPWGNSYILTLEQSDIVSGRLVVLFQWWSALPINVGAFLSHVEVVYLEHRCWGITIKGLKVLENFLLGLWFQKLQGYYSIFLSLFVSFANIGNLGKYTE